MSRLGKVVVVVTTAAVAVVEVQPGRIRIGGAIVVKAARVAQVAREKGMVSATGVPQGTPRVVWLAKVARVARVKGAVGAAELVEAPAKARAWLRRTSIPMQRCGAQVTQTRTWARGMRS